MRVKNKSEPNGPRARLGLATLEHYDMCLRLLPGKIRSFKHTSGRIDTKLADDFSYQSAYKLGDSGKAANQHGRFLASTCCFFGGAAVAQATG